MNEYIKWGGAGIALAVAGAAIIASELLAGIASGNLLMVAYGVAVIIAMLTTVVIIAPSFRKNPDPVDHD